MANSLVSQTFNATGTWVAPAGVVLALVAGFGGGGGASSTGGGGGSRWQAKLVAVVPGTSYSVTVGAGGTSGGGNGGSTTFGSLATFAGANGSTTAAGGSDGVQADGDTSAPQTGGAASSSGLPGPTNAYTGGTNSGTNGGGGAGGGGNGANGGAAGAANTGAGAGGGGHAGGSGQLTVYWWRGLESQTFSANGTWVAPDGYAGPVLCLGTGGTTTSLQQASIFQAVPGQSYSIVAGTGVTVTVKLGSAQVFGAYANTGGTNNTGTVTLYWWPIGAAVASYNANNSWASPPGYASPVLLFGFGGGGGGSQGWLAGGAGAGSMAQLAPVIVQPGTSYSITIGAAGAGAAAGGGGAQANGGPGGATTFGSLASFMGGQGGEKNESSGTALGGFPDTAHAVGASIGSSLTDTSWIVPNCGGTRYYNNGALNGPNSQAGFTSWQGFIGGIRGTNSANYGAGAGGGGGPNGTGGNGGDGALGGIGVNNGGNGASAAANSGAGGGAGGGGGSSSSASKAGAGGAGGSGQLVLVWFPSS